MLIHKHNFRKISVAIIFETEINNLVRGVNYFESGDRIARVDPFEKWRSLCCES